MVLLSNLLLTLGLVRRSHSVASNASDERPVIRLNKGEAAPDFAAQPLHGAWGTLSEYRGRTTALVFARHTCQPCHEMLPSLEGLYPKASQQGVNLVLVSLADEVHTAALLREFNLEIPTLVASPESNPFARDYGVDGTPSFCLIDAEGQIALSGPTGGDAWKKLTTSWAIAKGPIPALATVKGGDK